MRYWLCIAAVFATPVRSIVAEPLSPRIDSIVVGTRGKPATAPASDAEFLRRVSLDLAGVIPSSAEVRSFLDNQSPDKRRLLVDRLLTGQDFPRRMQQAFSVMLLERRAGATIADEDWELYLRDSFEKNKPLDQLVRELLSADGTDSETRAAMKFFLARSASDHKLLARDVGRLLLGRNLECAQCHDHPSIDDYKQSEFFGLVAFLNRSYLYRDKKTNNPFFIEKGIGPAVEFTSVFTSKSQNAIPQILGGDAIEVPEFEKGQELQEPANEGGPPLPKFSLRPLLAEQLTSTKNRAFARNMANRLWAMMMGRGLVHPLDMNHDENRPSHPVLLELLTDELVASKFDVKHFLRELALSKTYQRSSRFGEAGECTPESFAAFNMKPLSAEQLTYSMMRATGCEQRVMDTPADKAATAKYRPDKGRPIPAENLDNVLKLFRSVYAAQPGQAEDEFVPSVAAALFSENEGLLLRWLTPESGNLMDRLSKLKEPAAIADELYVSILTRRPTDSETAAVAEYLKNSNEDREILLREMAWALLVSSEFRFNH